MLLGEELERNITEAWLKLRKQILSDPLELQRRLARRRLKVLTRPPRAWCIALRASDRRITPLHWLITPPHAMQLNHPEHPYEPIEHTVTIQKHGIRRLCNPVSFSREDALDVAKMLGVSPRMLMDARRRGQFAESFYKNLGGKHGKPVPLLSSRKQLFDPSRNQFARPHPIWGCAWEFLSRLFPDDFEQTVTRRPIFRPISSRTAALGSLPHTASQRLSDDYRLRGYLWICPSCKKPCRKIFYPFPVRTLVGGSGDSAINPFIDPVIQLKLTDADLPHIPFPTFACMRCHQVNHISPIEPRFWNHLVSFLTAGLLFGREVQKPAAFSAHRVRTRTRQLNRSSPIMRKVLTRFTNDWSYSQIAENLGLTVNAVHHHIRRACAQENVKTPHALAQKLGHKTSLPKSRYQLAAARREKVQQLLLQNLSHAQIARELNIPLYLARDDTRKIYRSHGLSGLKKKSRAALAQKLGLPLPPTEYDLLREKIAHLKDQGMTNIQIRRQLNLHRGTVEYHVQKIKESNAQTAAPAQSPPMASVGKS